MKEPEAKAQIDAVFDEHWPQQGLDKKYSPDFRAKIAQELLQLETDEYRETLRAKAETALQEKLTLHEKLWESSGLDLASEDPDVQAM